ncbi:efflux RND transporter periplasmic adaptor subunit [Lentisphaerota bacterium WC36G]|nr:efflux RND transporter periplasmic adaptor subunit [Lentisphaerae bacterium WC36]
MINKNKFAVALMVLLLLSIATTYAVSNINQKIKKSCSINDNHDHNKHIPKEAEHSKDDGHGHSKHEDKKEKTLTCSDNDGHDHSEHAPKKAKRSKDDGHDHSKHEDKKEKTLTCSDNDGHDHNEHVPKKARRSKDDGHDHSKHEFNKEAKITSTCSAGDGHDHSEDETSTIMAEDGSIKLSSEQLKMIKLTQVKPQVGSLSNSVILPGELSIKRENVSKVAPHLLSYVTKVNNILGDKVKKGDILAVLTSRDLASIVANYITATAELELAKSEFERQKKLMASKVVAKKEFLITKRDYLNAMAEVHKSQDILTSLGVDFKKIIEHFNSPKNDTTANGHTHIDCASYLLKSPINGTIIGRDISLGETFAEDNTKAVFTIANLEELYLDLQAGQQYLKSLKVGNKVKVTINNIDKVIGEISFIGNIMSTKTRTALVRISIDNKMGKFKVGMFATGLISLSPEKINKSIVIVSEKSVQTVQGENVVFVQRIDGNFITKDVKLGLRKSGMIEIISGLTINDKIVEKGAYELKSIMTLSGVDPHAGHGH